MERGILGGDAHEALRTFVAPTYVTIPAQFLLFSCVLCTFSPSGSSESENTQTAKCSLSMVTRSNSGPRGDLLQLSQQGNSYTSEVYCDRLTARLNHLASRLQENPSNGSQISEILSPDFVGMPLRPSREKILRVDTPLKVFRGIWESELDLDRDTFSTEFRALFEHYEQVFAADFQIVEIANGPGNGPLLLKTRILYDVVGRPKNCWRGQRIGEWELEWRLEKEEWRITKWKVVNGLRSEASRALTADVSMAALGGNSSYHQQLALGIDHWRGRLDGAVGINVHGNHGISAGDVDNDGYDDIYLSQPAGLPNRLFRNNGDGTFTDITHKAGVAVLDNTSMSLFADMDNDGDQDLIVISSFGPLLFVNQGEGTFQERPNSFKLAETPRAEFTGAAIADYDRDGFLDLYLCAYGYYLGAGNYRFATPYYDANNGPSNFLLRNRGDGVFLDVTASSGMQQNNHRFSFAATWCDYNRDGWADLYVANDFGRNNLYRNNGNGTFSDVAEYAGVEDIGAGMSVSWLDYNRDGWPDLYIGNMWSSAGLRITQHPSFQASAPLSVKKMLQRHAKGNSLFHNVGDGTFREVGFDAGVERGGWAWGSDFIDLDNDGYDDLYIANGMITGTDPKGLASFFWREVVSRSPLKETPSSYYEKAWTRIVDLIHRHESWAGRERNVFYLNNRDGTFSNVSGVVELDFESDSRSFAVTDVDHDGDSDIILMSRTPPGIQVLRNEIGTTNESVSIRLRGHRSNRDAVGARVTVFGPEVSLTRTIHAGSGFLSQRSKELSFGLGKAERIDRVRIEWPSGAVQELLQVPAGHRISVEEGVDLFTEEPFRKELHQSQALEKQFQGSRRSVESGAWLIESLWAPDFTLFDVYGDRHHLSDYRGRPLVLCIWAPHCFPSQLLEFEKSHKEFEHSGLEVLTIAVEKPDQTGEVKRFVRNHGLELTVLVAEEAVLTAYNTLKEYLFNERTDMQIPTTLLLNRSGEIEKIYQGPVQAGQILMDFRRLADREDRVARALPFAGQFYSTRPRRNLFQLGVAFFEKGLLDSARFFLEQSAEMNPIDPHTHYNLGILYMKTALLGRAAEAFEKALELKKDYPEAHNNLGVLFAQQDRWEDALAQFETALAIRPYYAEAANNLAALYDRQGKTEEALRILEKNLSQQDRNIEILNNLGMLYAKKGALGPAEGFFSEVLNVQPDHPEAATNLALVQAQQGKTEVAIKTLLDTLERSPGFEKAYLVLATVYSRSGNKEAAVAALRKLLRENPAHLAGREALRKLNQ